MEQSLTLLTAQIHFLDTKLALIHIPLHLYNAFIPPILQLLIPAKSGSTLESETTTDDSDVLRPRRPWAYEHPFVNVSLTPVECSVACSRALAGQLFVPILETLDEASRRQVIISEEDYVVIQVDGDGEALEAGQRVVELTAPLAMNGISIFFITTYFSDYILVPLKTRSTVVKALEDRGFVFESHSEAFVNVSSPLLTSSTLHSRNTSAVAGYTDNPFESSLTALDEQRPPSTPPPSSVAELESRTFALLSRRNITPFVDPSIQLLQCAGRRDLSMRSGVDQINNSAAIMSMRLQLGLVRCLIRMPRARFFSVTLTDTEPASLLLEKDLLAEFEDGKRGDDDVLLLGSRENAMVPITFDLRELPVESTGIVCGVAGRLVGGMRSRPNTGDHGGDDVRAPSVEMSYLSTARAGTVMVAEADLETALETLERKTGAFDHGVGARAVEDPALSEAKPMPIRGRP